MHGNILGASILLAGVGMSKKLHLFLMQKRGLAVLQALLAHKEIGAQGIAYVVGAKDTNVQEDFFREIKTLAESNNLPFYTRSQENRPPAQGLSLAIGWRWLIADATKLVVLHDSLLPKYRGFAPVVCTLIEGDPLLGATAFFASPRYDEGPILAQGSVQVEYPIKISAALDALLPVFQDVASRVACQYFSNTLGEGVEQDSAEATYSLWRDELDYSIDWGRDSAYIRRVVDAVGPPFLCATTYLNENLVRILDCEPVKDRHILDRQRHIGKVIFLEEGLPVVVCGQGLLKISAMTDTSGVSLLPLKKLRSRFR